MFDTLSTAWTESQYDVSLIKWQICHSELNKSISEVNEHNVQELPYVDIPDIHFKHNFTNVIV